jgi:hypothetical protein
MAGMRQALEETLQAPTVVVESLSDPAARLYHRFYVRTMVGEKYLCVVVKFLFQDAFVVTAYLTDQVKKGKIVWPEKP